MNNRTIHAVALGLFLGWFCLGCGKNPLGSSTPVPLDCQQFLDKYFAAIKAKDVGKVQDMTSYITGEATKEMPQKGVDFLRESQRRLTAQGLERMNQELGDFRSYSVLSVNVTTQKAETVEANMVKAGLHPQKGDTVMANMMGAGIHAEIVCKTRFSKQSPVRLWLHLFKETQEAEYSILAWKYEIEIAPHN